MSKFVNAGGIEAEFDEDGNILLKNSTGRTYTLTEDMAPKLFKTWKDKLEYEQKSKKS